MHRITLIIAALLGLLAFAATPLRADTEADFERVREDIFAALVEPISAGMTAKLQERRRLLRHLFLNVPPEFAPEFLAELGEFNNGGEFSARLHGELSTAARRELLDILRDHIVSLDSGLPPPINDTNEQPVSLPEIPHFGFGAMPPERQAEFDQMIPQLETLAAQFSGERRRRLGCMVRFLATPGIDDRVIKWSHICPDYDVPNIPLFTGCPPNSLKTDSQTMKDKITSIAAIDRQGASLRFVTHLRSDFLWLQKFGTVFDLTLKKLDQELIDTNTFVQQMTTAPSGGGSMAPYYVRHIKRWISSQQKTNSSVMYCFGN